MMRSVVVRDAVEADLPAILAIHSTALDDSTSLWDVDPADLYDRVECSRSTDDGWPVLVGEWEGQVAGYAGFGPWRTQAGYTQTVQNSLFVAQDYRGRGVGSTLLRHLINRARKADIHTMIAGIESRNTVSIALHKKYGFEPVAHLPEVAKKSDEWLDLDLMQLILREPLLDRIAHLLIGV